MKTINKFSLLLGTVLLAFTIGAIFSTQYYDVKPAFSAGSKEMFNYLSTAKISTSSSCGLQQKTVDNFSDQDNVQGACCGSMDFHRYQEQVEGLKQYKKIPIIPNDPYNIPVKLNKELFRYQKSINLNKQQQSIYDQAINMSKEGGPCCCRCWRWTAFEGLAKYLIAEKGFNGQQIASLWDLLDGCGGPGHVGEGGEH